MPLPYFGGNTRIKFIASPFWSNLCEIDFGNDYLNEQIISCVKHIISFNIIKSETVEPIETIQELIKNNFVFDHLEMKHFDQEGAVIRVTVIKNFRFTKIMNLMDFDYSNPLLKKLEVKFKFDSAIFMNGKRYFPYNRKRKLDKIKNI